MPDPSPQAPRYAEFFNLIETATKGDRPFSVILDSLLDAAIETLDAERAFVVTEDEKGNLRPVRSRNFTLGPVTSTDSRDLFSQSAVRRCLESGEHFVCRDISTDKRLKNATSVEALALESVVVQPLLLRKKLLGVLVVDSRARPESPYTEERLGLFRVLAGSAALTFSRWQAELVRETAEENELIGSRRLPRGLVGRSKAMEGPLLLMRRAALCSANVLIWGETGTGKEVFARALHEASKRSKRAFVAESMANLSETLMESTLFGHEPGAFTGATTKKAGLFQLAHGGTIFLDEIGEASMAVQTKLLRILQERKCRPLGGEKEIEVDVRVIAATNRDLRAMIKAGTFREDLYYRLNVVQLRLPPLRERLDDIPELAAHFLKELKEKDGRAPEGLARDALDRLRTHSWPGNVRELGNVIARAAVMAKGKIRAEDIEFEDAAPERGGRDRASRLSEFKKYLEQFVGNVGKAAKAMGLPMSTAFNWRKKLEERGEIERRPGS